MKTRITELLGIRHPIMQGGMHHVGYAPPTPEMLKRWLY